MAQRRLSRTAVRLYGPQCCGRVQTPDVQHEHAGSRAPGGGLAARGGRRPRGVHTVRPCGPAPTARIASLAAAVTAKRGVPFTMLVSEAIPDSPGYRIITAAAATAAALWAARRISAVLAVQPDEEPPSKEGSAPTNAGREERDTTDAATTGFSLPPALVELRQCVGALGALSASHSRTVGAVGVAVAVLHLATPAAAAAAAEAGDSATTEGGATHSWTAHMLLQFGSFTVWLVLVVVVELLTYVSMPWLLLPGVLVDLPFRLVVLRCLGYVWAGDGVAGVWLCYRACVSAPPAPMQRAQQSLMSMLPRC
jgi:hypothetical protein